MMRGGELLRFVEGFERKEPTSKEPAKGIVAYALERLLHNLADLIKVKTIITLAVIGVFCFKAIRGMELPNEFVMIATAIVTYYFTKAETQKEAEKEAGLSRHISEFEAEAQDEHSTADKS